MSHAPLVRLIDDDEDLLSAQLQSLKLAGFEAEGFSDPLEALQGLSPSYPGVILSDVMMPGIDGIELFHRIRAMDPDLPVILLTGHGDIEMAVTAMRDGAWDFLTKPVSAGALSQALRRAVQARSLVLENRALKAGAGDAAAGRTLLLGTSVSITRLHEAALRLGEAGVDVLITGPSGAGKGALAEAIHAAGQRRRRPLVHLACDTLDEARFDIGLFGAEAGHPDAPRHARLPGRLERAHRGTLWLDRVEKLTPALQARLLHVIEAREFWSAGATAPRPLDMHVIATTSADLPSLAREGLFNADLCYRLSGVTLHMPPLAERREDIPVLFRAFLLEACRRYSLPLPPITPLIRARLDSYDWPGNARELRQFAEAQALGLDSGSSEDGGEAAGPPEDLAHQMASYEASLLREALRASKGNVTKAMQRLNLPRKTIYDKLTRHGIRPESFRDKSG